MWIDELARGLSNRGGRVQAEFGEGMTEWRQVRYPKLLPHWELGGKDSWKCTLKKGRS